MGVYFYLGKNTGSVFTHSGSVENLFRSNWSYVFFVRGFGCALFYLWRNRMRKLSKLSAVILTITIAFCMTTVNPIFVNAVNTTIEQVGSCGGVQEKLNSIASVYPTGSYFTASGNVCYSNQSSDCQLSNIPSRGGLPSGATAANVTRDAWSCCAFARYVFYCTFGLAPESCGTVSSSNAQIGDYMNLGSHYAIYLGQDSTYWYVYDSNYTSPATNVVKYNRALRKSNFSSVQIHHASNYDTINNSSVNRTISIWGLENNHEILSATKLWAKRFDNDDNHYAVFYIDNQPITGHIQSDSSDYFSVNVDPHDYSQGVHAFKVFYANSTSSDTDIKNIYINYDSVQGDVNLDGVINISYATTVQKLLAQLIDFSDDQKAVADTNGDGIINISDATQIQKYLAQLIPSLG